MMIDAFRTRFAVASQDGMEWNGMERTRFRRPMRSMRRRRRRRRRRRVANESNRDSEKVSFIRGKTNRRSNERFGTHASTPSATDAGRRRRSTTAKMRVFLAIGKCGERIGRRASTFTTTSREWLFTGCALLSFSSSRAVPIPVDAPRWRRERMETHA